MKIWVAITAHNPMSRINNLVNVFQNYKLCRDKVTIKVYVNYEAKDECDLLEQVLDSYGVDFEVIVCDKKYQGFSLCWAHKQDLIEAVRNQEADLYIYQEDDVSIQQKHIDHYIYYRPVLHDYGLVPGFCRYEKKENLKVLFDNQEIHPLGGTTRKIWGDISFDVMPFFVNDEEICVFSQLQNPYYAAMIMDQEEADEYVNSKSVDVHQSAHVVGFRSWPIADRSSMSTAFENVLPGFQHNRAVAVVLKDEKFAVADNCLIEHFGSKYSDMLVEQGAELLNYDQIFVGYEQQGNTLR